MIKSIPRSNISIRPFVTFKNWTLQNQNYESFITTEDGCPLFTYYVTESGQPCDVNTCYPSYSLVMEQQPVDQKFSVQAGENIQGIFYPVGDSFYNSESNPVNHDGTYKRLIYNTTKNLFYKNLNKPLSLFGIENYDSGLEKRNIWDSVIVGNIPNQIFGERIQSGSVTIIDNSSIDQQVILKDDGYTNLIVANNSLVNEQQVGAVPSVKCTASYYDPAHDRFGASVAAWNGYVVAGSPVDKESFSQLKAGSGSAFLYKYDSAKNSYLPIKKLYSPFTRDGYETEFGLDGNPTLMAEINNFLISAGTYKWLITDTFGSAVAINNNTLAIGSTTCDFCSESGSGQVYIYGKYKGGTDNWGIISVLQGSSSLDNFGASISISGTKMAIGAPSANNGKGRVYIFKQDVYGTTMPTSSFWYTLTKQDDWCATIVSETPDTASYNPLDFVSEDSGSLFDLEPSSSLNLIDYTSSACNIIIPTSASLLETENPFPPTPVDELNTDSDVYYEIAGEDGTPSFVTGNFVWTLEAIIETNTTGEFFGSSISLSGSLLAVGNGCSSGSVYMFESQSIGWIRTTQFTKYGIMDTVSCSFCEQTNVINDFNTYNPNAISESVVTNTYFGNSVALNNGVLLIGVPNDLVFNPYSGSTQTYQVGSVYAYTKFTEPDIQIVDYDCGLPVTASIPNCGWKLVKQLYESSSVHYTNNQFGYSLSMDNKRFVIGALYGSSYVTTSYDSTNQVLDIQEYDVTTDGPLYSDKINGKAFVYSIEESGSFNLEKIITKQKKSNSVKSSFGYNVAVDANHVIVGSPVFMYGGSYVLFSEENQSASFEEESSDITFVPEGIEAGVYQPITYINSSLLDLIPSTISGSFFAYDMNDLYATQSAGNIFYKDGIIAITSTASAFQNALSGTGPTGYVMQFQGTHTIYEHEILCEISPGEFNTSTNPTSLVNGSIPFDVNNDGVFDVADFNYIMQSYYDDFIADDQTDDNGVESEITPKSQWWGDDIIMTESEDVILLEPYLPTITSSYQTPLSTTIQQNLTVINNNGDMDINGDGKITIEDSRILVNYFLGKRDASLVTGNITPSSTRTSASQVLSFLDNVTGKQNGLIILPTFENYVESSSIDPTGSYLAPYITTIGLYDDGVLVAVAKLGQPIKNLIDYPINFVVTYDQ